MLVQPLRIPSLGRLPGEAPALAPARVAVMLNANARSVTPRVIDSLSRVVSEGDLFVSRSEVDARRIVQTVLERRYAVAFTGGGDGTFVGFVNALLHEAGPRGRHAGARLPRLGVLKLGTGNALASFVHASGRERLADDVLRARSGGVPCYRRMHLVEVEGTRVPFAGLGVDGKVLNDYIWVKRSFARGALKRLLTGTRGYFSAVALRTLPHYLTHSTSVECEAVNAGTGPAWRIGEHGEPVGEPIAPGEVLFRGRTMMAATATMPFYGYGLRMFPFADRRRGLMQLRVGQVGVGEVLANLPALWKGRWFPEGVQDFYVQSVTLRYEKPQPLQVGGDAAGYRDVVTMSVAPEMVELLDFRGPVN